MSGSRRDCFDWPERPHLQGALSAPAPATPAQDAAGAPVPGGEGFASLLTLAAILALPLSLVLIAQVLIEAMQRTPIVFVTVGAAMLFAGLIGWALSKAAAEPWRIEDDEEAVCLPSGLMGVRYQ